MDLIVKGGQTLSGEITPSGSKNAAVALIPATLLFDEPVTFTNVPDITDVVRLVKIIEALGGKTDWDKTNKTLTINNSNINVKGLGREELGNMRGTALLWGPMLARFGEVSFEELPGGCTLGVRPLNPHYDAFSRLGVIVDSSDKSTRMDASKAAPSDFWLTEMSPTVTENIIMLAVTLNGITRVTGAASEPNVQDLCNFLVASGADIRGVGSSIIEIHGGKPLHSVKYKIITDHYEIATFLALGAGTGGEVKITDAIPEHFSHIDFIFSQFGVNVEYLVSEDGKSSSVVVRKGQNLKINETNGMLNIKAQPWPGLPVDMLPMFMPLALKAPSGLALFHNWMYESGLFWTSEFQKYGAAVLLCDPHRVLLRGGQKLYGAEIEAPYIIRAVVSLMMTAMIAEGESLILNADAIHRGHPNFIENLRSLGANIEEVKR